MKKIYLATPYSHENEKIMQRRFEFSCHVTAKLMDNQTVVFSPIAHSHCIAEIGSTPTNWQFWKEQDLPLIEWADTVVVLCARGWRESTGVQAEIEHAEEVGTEVQKAYPIEYVDLIGVSGKKRSGKDTFADRLVERGYERYSLADPIKEAAKSIFGWNDEEVDGTQKEDEDAFWGMTPRKALQIMGTDLFREEFGKNIWLNSLERKIDTYLPRKVVVPDLRFPNEVEFIQSRGGEVIRIDTSERLDSEDSHESETALDGYSGYDHVIDNNGSLEEFHDNIDTFLENNGC